jgi:hypothetical protein
MDYQILPNVMSRRQNVNPPFFGTLFLVSYWQALMASARSRLPS